MIYFLDDELKFEYTPTSTGYVEYNIAMNVVTNTIYTGNIYCTSGKKVTIYINDIIANYRWIEKITTSFSTETHTIPCRINFYLVIGGNQKGNILVQPCYRYPNKAYDKYIQDAWDDEAGSCVDVLPLLQSSYNWKVVDGENIGNTKVIPHIPFIKTDNYGLQNCYWLDCHEEKISEDEIATKWMMGNTQAIQFTDLYFDENCGYSHRASLKAIYGNRAYTDTLYIIHDDLQDYTNHIPSPSKQKVWNTTTRRYDDCSYYSNYTLTVPFTCPKLQIGTINNTSQYVTTETLTCDGDIHTFSFMYTPQTTLIEFSLRDNGEVGAQNNEIAFFQFPLTSAGLTGRTYRLDFTHAISNNQTIISGISMYEDRFSPIAKIDRCPARYYMMWQDRLGGIQSQGFDGKCEFGETFTNTTAVNFKGEKRNINTQIQPKWELNTKWLTDEEYPIYESIFVSPYVLLYDTETDKSYNVIPTGKSYTEKTWENNKKKFNLTIEVELNKQQNLLA